MSLGETVPKYYVPWTPNRQVIHFFKELKARRVASQPSDPSTIRVSNTPPPGNGSNILPKKSKTRKTKVVYSTPSDIIAKTALSVTGAKPASPSLSTVAEQKPRKSPSKKGSQKKKSPSTTKRLEKKLKGHKF